MKSYLTLVLATSVALFASCSDDSDDLGSGGGSHAGGSHAGSRATEAGNGGAEAGGGGTSAGSGGAEAGSAGAEAGSGGAEAGSSASAGSAGAEAGSGGAEAGSGGAEGSLPPVVAVSDMTSVSADNYAWNRFGLIEADTLEAYATNWDSADSAAANAAPNGRPQYLDDDARLIVLQLNPANRAAGENFVPSDPGNNVYTYEIDAFRFNETRDTGLISNSVRYQASGPTTDEWLARYGVDLSRDFLVFAVGENTATPPSGAFFQDLARAVYWLSYWGADLEHLAIVNGSLQKNYAGPLVSNKVTANQVSNGGFSVKSLRVDHTGLTLALEDFLKVVDSELEAEDVIPGFDEQLIIDARPTAQWNRTTNTAAFFSTVPGQFITTAWSSSGAPSEDATGQGKNYVLYEGHVKGSTSFPWASLLEDADAGDDFNFKYKNKAALEDIFEAAGYAPGERTSKVIVSQCRTNFEVQVNGFAARVILGYPTVHFDGSLVEYFSLVSGHPDSDFNLEEGDAAYQYRTDIPTRSQHYAPSTQEDAPPTLTEDDEDGVPAYNVPTGTSATDRKVDQAIIDKDATTTRKALNQDREYKRQ